MSYSWNVCDPLLDTAHTLIAGTTGSGKSVLLNSTIYSAMQRDAVFYFIDLKRVELSRYRNYMDTWGFATEPEEVIPLLDEVIAIMEDRYRNMTGTLSDECDIYVFIDELADLVTYKGVIDRLIKIGRLGRAAKVHMICATQDPSRRTLVAGLMQNFTCTVALRCRSSIESRQIIGVAGAEELPKYGTAYRWDADGIEKFEVPLTPDEDIDEFLSIHPYVPPKKQFRPFTWIAEKINDGLIWLAEEINWFCVNMPIFTIIIVIILLIWLSVSVNSGKI